MRLYELTLSLTKALDVCCGSRWRWEVREQPMLPGLRGLQLPQVGAGDD